MSESQDRSRWWRGWADRGAAITVVSLVFCLMVFSGDSTASQSTVALGLTLIQWLALLCLALSAGGTGLCFWAIRARRRSVSLASQ